MSEDTHRSRWASSGAALWGGIVLAVCVAASIFFVAVVDRRGSIDSEMQQNVLLANVLDSQSARKIETIRSALRSIAETYSRSVPWPQRKSSALGLSEALAGMPTLRGIVLADQRGQVVTDTFGSSSSKRLDLAALGKLPQEDQDAMGPLLTMRQLYSRETGAPALAAPLDNRLIPLVQRFVNAQGESWLLIGLLKPDALAGFEQLPIVSAGRRAVIANFSGTVLAASLGSDLLVGGSIAETTVFQSFLPSVESGNFIGPSIGGERQMVAFTASRSRDTVVLIEQSYEGAMARWLGSVRNFSIVGAIALLVIVVLTFAAWRSARAREMARQHSEQSREQIARNERDMSVLMRSVQELIFRTDAYGAITFVNARWKAMTGKRSRDALGRHLADIVHPEGRAAVRALFHHLHAEGARTAQAKLTGSDGRVLHLDIAILPLVTHGSIDAFAGSAVDVTERWEAQEQLRAQLAFTEQLLEVNPLPISMTDLDGRLKVVNKAWEEFEAVPRLQAIGQPLANVLPDIEAIAQEAAHTELLRQGGSSQFESRTRRHDGSIRDTRFVKAVVPNGKGGALGVLSVQMDISEFRKAERATREAYDAAQEASRVKSEFVANMSHELRTPLQSILGFSELGMMPGRHVHRQLEMFQDIHGAGQRMLALVNDLLDVAKIESSVGTFHLEAVDLRGQVRSVMREFEPLVASKHLDLNVSLDEAPLIAKADPARFQQVIRNVVANAIRFSPVGGKIDVSGQRDAAGQLHFSIKDQGPGIPEGEVERIFDAFVQSTKTKDGSGGTGLGLAISRKIVDAHGGKIYAENRERGTAFHVRLPAKVAGMTDLAAL